MKHSKLAMAQEAQYLRKGRLTLSIAASAVTVGMTLIVAQAGYIPMRAALTYGAVVALFCAAFYAAFASGLNRKFADPSLTLPQLVAAGLAVSYAAYHGSEARPAFMAMYLIAYTFGVFTLRTRGLVAVAGFYLACYAAVAALSLLWQPELADVRREAFRVLTFGVVLGWMAYMGSYIAELRHRLRQEAQRDGLTGAFNRRHMMSLLAVEAARAERGAALSLCLADMDNFKEINDTYGHDAGDRALQTLSATLKTILRNTDIAGRYGGDEFMIILPETTVRGAESLAEKLLSAVRETELRLPDDKHVRLSMSIGIAGLEADRTGENIDSFVKRADDAMYVSKQGGKDRVSIVNA